MTAPREFFEEQTDIGERLAHLIKVDLKEPRAWSTVMWLHEEQTDIGDHPDLNSNCNETGHVS